MLSKYVPKRISSFDAQEAMTVIDYGCGSGRYIGFFSKKVGIDGKVYAIDIDPKAIKDVEKLVKSLQLANVVPVLADGYNSGIPAGVADRIYVIDMFHGIDEVSLFLKELIRIAKPKGLLYIDYGHQPKKQALKKIEEADVCDIVEIYSQYVVCKSKS